MIGEKPVDENLVRCYSDPESILMVLPANHRSSITRRSAYFWLPILCIALALAVSVITRTSVLTVSHSVSIKDDGGSAILQHMDNDGVQWVPPVATVVIALVVILAYPRIAPAGPPIPDLFYKETLYNRPPPTC
jgi:hypothetical protein